MDATGAAVWEPIKEVFVYEGKHDVYELNFRNVRGKFTPNHRIIRAPGYDADFKEMTMEEEEK